MTDTRETRASASEIKFLLDEGQVPAIRAWARANLQPDPHGDGPFADAYTTSTLYFDTRQLDVFHRRELVRPCQVPRPPLRRRRLGVLRAQAAAAGRADQAPDGRLDRRAAAPRAPRARRRLGGALVPPPAAGAPPPPGLPGDLRPHGAHRPTAEGLVRLTLDSNLRATPVDAPAFAANAGEQFLAGHNILELKYHARVPAVFRRLIEEFALKPQTASKYRLAVAAVRHLERPAPLGLRPAGDAAAYV